jgi:hypothetical protein
MRIVYVYMTQHWKSHKLKFQVITKRSGRLGQRCNTDECVTGRGSVFLSLGLLRSAENDLMRSVERHIL